LINKKVGGTRTANQSTPNQERDALDSPSPRRDEWEMGTPRLWALQSARRIFSAAADDQLLVELHVEALLCALLNCWRLVCGNVRRSWLPMTDGGKPRFLGRQISCGASFGSTIVRRATNSGYTTGKIDCVELRRCIRRRKQTEKGNTCCNGGGVLD
jgi:hypothetical protein